MTRGHSAEDHHLEIQRDGSRWRDAEGPEPSFAALLQGGGDTPPDAASSVDGVELISIPLASRSPAQTDPYPAASHPGVPSPAGSHPPTARQLTPGASTADRRQAAEPLLSPFFTPVHQVDTARSPSRDDLGVPDPTGPGPFQPEVSAQWEYPALREVMALAVQAAGPSPQAPPSGHEPSSPLVGSAALSFAPAAEPVPDKVLQPPFPPVPEPTGRSRRGLVRHGRQTASFGAVESPPSRGIPLDTAVRAYHASAEYVAWKPRMSVLVISFFILSVYSLWSFHPNRTALGWALTVVWSMPIVGSLVGIQGAFLLRRHSRRQDRMTPPKVSTKDTLVVVVPTIGRHDTYPALERAVLSFVEHLPVFFTRFRTDVVIEEGCEAIDRIRVLGLRHPQIRIVTVPRDYQTPRGTRFKARANHYAHELRIAEGEARDDVWVLHMDDDTAVGSDTAAAVAQFINRQRRAGAEGKHLAQGVLTYPRENAVNWLTWMADAVRPADDFARFRAITGSGTPAAGLHGELLLLRASIEATIGWDFGPKALVEDAQFALTFCKLYPGRSDWFNGRCYGASPSTVRDFIKQRERWSWGLVGLSLNRSIPLRYRAFIGWSVLTWVLGPLQHLGVVLLIAWALGYTSTSPVTESVLLLWATNFAFVIWSYWEGLRLNALCSARPGRRWFEPFLVVLLIPVFALMEGLGGLRGFLKFLTRRENKFVVIAKPA